MLRSRAYSNVHWQSASQSKRTCLWYFGVACAPGGVDAQAAMAAAARHKGVESLENMVVVTEATTQDMWEANRLC